MKKSTAATLAAVTLSAGLAGCANLSMPFGIGWTTLVDGTKGMENFRRVGDANWSASDGVIQASSGGKDAGYLVSTKSYKDFMIRAEFWASDDANSGVFMRCQDPAKITDETCYEANIFDQRPDQTYATGGIVHRGKVLQPVKAGGKWNVFDITAKGSTMTVVLNGTKTAEINNVEFPAGPIALQFGNLPPNAAPAGAIKFRKVQVRPL
jgi:hypothetical protein